VRRGVPGEQEVAAQVDPHDQIELLVGHVEQHPVARDAGVVDHDVQGAEGFPGGLHDQVRGGRLADIPWCDGHFGAERLDLGGGLVGRPWQVVEHDACPGAGQR
jgi:hypothetical protein